MNVEGVARVPAETPTVAIHCVTKWSKLDATWKGVSGDTMLAAVGTEAQYMSAWCDGGYTTNLPLEDVTGGRAWIAYEFGGEPLHPQHGGPARLLVPHASSAVGLAGLRATDRRQDAGERGTRSRANAADLGVRSDGARGAGC